MPQASKILRSCVQTEREYLKLINLVFEGKPEVLPAAWMNWYMKVRILQVYLERVISLRLELVVGEYILIVFYLDFSLENDVYFFKGAERYRPAAPLYVY